LTGANLSESKLRTLEGTRDGVKEVGDAPWVGICVIERAHQKRARDRALVDVHAFGETSKLLGVRVVERDVNPVGIRRAGHQRSRLARYDTRRATLASGSSIAPSVQNWSLRLLESSAPSAAAVWRTARREVFLRLSEQIAEQRVAHGVTEEDVLSDFAAERRRR
jgi:hypothetical protein